jgi:hypothetical protein
MIPVFLATIQKGRLVFNNPDGFEKYLYRLNDKSVDVVVRLPRKERSSNQNKYYFGVVVSLLSEHTGYTPDEIHSLLKEKFLSKIIVLAGKDERIPRSSTELSTIEWERWMTEIREWAAQELNLVIPEPNQVEVEQ